MADILSTPADGNTRIVFVPTLADPGAPKVTELNAGTAADLSCYITADGWSPGADQATITDDRLCDTETYARPGRKSYTLSTTYVTNIGDEDNDLAATTLVEGTAGFFIERKGLPFDTAFAAGQLVNVWPVQTGAQVDVAPEANSVERISQSHFITGGRRFRVAVVAGT